MATGDAVDFQYYKYTDNNGATWQLKVDKTIGVHADFGFAARDAADPVFIKTARNYPRTVTLINAATGRTKVIPCGTVACDAFSDPAFTVDLKVRGLVLAIPYVSKTNRNEKLVRAGDIYNHPEPTSA